MIKDKKMRDSIKLLHNASGFSPQRSPPSPMPQEWSVPIPSVEDTWNKYEEEGVMDQLKHMFDT